MNFHKIIRIVAGLLGLAGIIFLVLLISKGDDAIKSAAAAGDTSTVDPMAFVAYITLALILFFVLFFVLKALFTNTATLKKTLVNVGAFLLLFLIAYFVFAQGVETPMRDGELLSASGSKMVGAGLYLFYFLIVIAAVLMVFSGAGKFLKK
ncbi:MAG: hypothetical protein KJO49_09720 [Bacteroidia bacterium]|nr:hypothetical protein [Bacteroidia bacterium]NNF82619.1 hypothetical protein [Flavobacteriaceae bacterium]NNK70421.1 hypothetical protein [Flavobacteriaceae bacterium]NNL80119.1 hypothetical protein [Flavobacteriaceae bacterium]